MTGNDQSENMDLYRQLPLRHRLLLKALLRLPNPKMPFFILKHFPEFEGIFSVVILPIFLILYFFFSVWLVSMASLTFDFPFNILIVLLIPSLIFVVFLRIQIERGILWWRSIHGEPLQWDVSKRTQELLELYKRQQSRRKRH